MLREIGPGRVTRYRLLGFQFAIILTGDSADCRTYIKNFWPPVGGEFLIRADFGRSGQIRFFHYKNMNEIS
jgi:hypothetical protein